VVGLDEFNHECLAMQTRKKRQAVLTPHAQRLTPAEVAQHWFRKGADFSTEIHEHYPTFPEPGPDGLFLLSQVKGWFDEFHGKKQVGFHSFQRESDQAMRAALGQG
jgi:hypothetical protein